MPGHGIEISRTQAGGIEGSRFEGIRVGKSYFKTFGYLPADAPVDEVFDETMESALRAYQQFFSLEVTGSTDLDTIRSMLTPRCGEPDFKSLRGDETVEPAYAFLPGNPRWPSSMRNLKYSFDSAVNVVPLDATRLAAPDRLIGFFRHDHGDGSPFDGPGGILAHSFPPIVGKLHLDADEQWSATTPGQDQVDLETVILHEIGHILGLNHSTVPTAVMFPTLPLGPLRLRNCIQRTRMVFDKFFCQLNAKTSILYYFHLLNLEFS
ncbi:hypothetical protein MLD38_001336 [Melastoma candidum]|uniref:Uncharacterized protein n=1 Tax=Melastoma candidum TaxID=119954 RepID=A0ACB9SE90_9MYRT|nr:hypothetical protein MLD38_001336 [Melastoma candidum]